jgi:DNA-binding response OmpR family regulator
MHLAMSTLALASGLNAGVTQFSSSNSRLTRKEKELLNILMQNPGRCISRETLLRTVWNYAEGARTRTVDVHVQRLRRKLGQEANAIKTIVRLGYCWFPESETESPAPVF